MAKIFFAALALLATAGLTPARAEMSAVETHANVHTGIASFYAKKFEGRRTANGERFSHTAYTAAHPTLPFGTHARVTNNATGKSVIVRITDRMSSRKTLVDLSRAAAEKLNILRAGRARVTLQVLDGIDAIVHESPTR
jgi:rare lipoprotein A